MKLILVRHGETEENRRGETQGHMPGKLSSLGIEQAKKLAQRLKDEKIDCIFSSDLARAADTAKEIHKFHSDVPIEFTEKLRELNMGEFQGKVHPKNWGEIKWKLNLFEPSGGERLDNFLERAKNFKNKILEEYPGKNILFVGHNGINRAIIAAINEKSWNDIKNVETQKNTAVTIFEFDENKNPSLVLMNSTEHLD